MIKYHIYQKHPASHYVYIDLHIADLNSEIVQLQLPAWRPGRYELGNFAKNIKKVEVYDEKNTPLSFTKLSKDLWEINCKGAHSLKVTYSYYAAELNAGACFADTHQLYLNPVHCCMFVLGRTEEPHQIELKLPPNYEVATSLTREGMLLNAANYEELVDSPFFASPQIQSDYYEVNEIKFYLHFVGECKPDFEKMKKDFTAFTKKLIDFWGDCPFDAYHFMFQVLPNKFYHGVEHLKSTVIAIGPGYAINEGSTYEDILGVSCHELFHAWNVKQIRPKEMLPYNYSKENYARTGYVYEGFTTYYGDKLLFASGVFSSQQYLETLKERLVKHFHNYGRYNLSVAQSSWESWLDGYVPGAPYRKTNIYDEGSLIALMLDVMILRATANKKSLRNLCVLLYERFGKKNIGYGEENIIELANEVSGIDLRSFFENYVYSPADFEVPLKECLSYLGIAFSREKNNQVGEHYFGFKTTDSGAFSKVTLVAPYSPSWHAGLFSGDEIIAVNEMLLKNNLNQWLLYFLNNDEIKLTVNSGERLKTCNLQKDKKGNVYFFDPSLKLDTKKAEPESSNLLSWMNN